MKVETAKINDGGGLWDKYGLIDNLITICNNIEVKGIRNGQLLYLVGNGLETLKKSLKEAEDAHEHSDPSER